MTVLFAYDYDMSKGSTSSSLEALDFEEPDDRERAVAGDPRMLVLPIGLVDVVV